MPLFVTQHRHSPETCPASEALGEQLLERVSAASAARYGVAIQAEAVIDGDQMVILILTAPARERVEEFMRFLEPFGAVEVLSASSAEEAVARGVCGSDRTEWPGRDV